MPSFLAGALVFFTSAAVLVLEILAGRLLAPYVGVTLETFTGIIGVVLAGIALGSYYGGKWADRINPREMLPPMLVIGGALGVASIPLVRTFGLAGLGSGPVAIVFLSTVGFFLPSAILSAVTPTVTKLQLGSLDETGQVVGRLSALSTVGALFGTFVTGFLLVATLPTPPIIYGVGGALILSGAVLWRWLAANKEDVNGAMIVAATIIAVGSAALSQLIGSPCDVESAYFCASVIVDDERPSGRLLVLDRLRHSYVDLDDPTHLEFTYAQAMSDVLDTFRPEGDALRALHIGGGGFTLPRYLEATRPGSFSRVLELDPEMVALAERELGLEVTDDLQVRTGDARINLRDEADDDYDLVIGDAFGGQAVPWHLTTVELLEEVGRVLAPDGLYAINLIDYPRLGFARSEAATLMAVFEHVVVIAPEERLERRAGGNFVMVASHQPIDAEAIQSSNDARGDDDTVLSDAAGLAEFIGDGIVLTDDYAPVDQLLTPLV